MRKKGLYLQKGRMQVTLESVTRVFHFTQTIAHFERGRPVFWRFSGLRGFLFQNFAQYCNKYKLFVKHAANLPFFLVHCCLFRCKRNDCGSRQCLESAKFGKWYKNSRKTCGNIVYLVYHTIGKWDRLTVSLFDNG